MERKVSDLSSRDLSLGRLAIGFIALVLTVPATAARSDDEDVERAMAEARRALESAQGELAEIEVVVGPGRGVFVSGARARRALIGITLVSQDDEQHSDEGVIVSAVSPGGPAAEAGIQAGDLIVRIDDTPLDERDGVAPERALVDYMSGVDPGEAVELTYQRDGDQASVMVETEAMGRQVFTFSGPDGGPGSHFRFDGSGPMGLRMDPETGRFIGARGGWTDMELVNLSEGADEYFGTDEGVLVVRAPRDEGFELQDWDVIAEIDGRVPRDPSHAMRILRSYMPGETLEVTIYRGGRRQTLEVEVPELRRRYEELLIPE
jgi:S1-C subfamily serine protease